MAIQEQYANLAWSSLASGIDAITTDLAVQEVDAHLFPLVGQFRLKVEDELMLATAVVASGRYTVTRGVENTTAVTHSGLSVVRHVLTAASVVAACGQTNLYGTFVSRPAAGVVGRQYWATDAQVMYRDNGISWDVVLESNGTKLLEYVVLSGQSQVDFSFAAHPEYDHFMFRFSGVLGTVANADFKARYSVDAGATFDASSVYDEAFQYISTTGSTAATGNTNLAQMDIGGDAAIATTAGLSGHWTVYRPLASGEHCGAEGRVTYGHNSVGRINIDRSHLHKTTLPRQQVRFFYDSGTLTRGEIHMYGWRKRP